MLTMKLLALVYYYCIPFSHIFNRAFLFSPHLLSSTELPRPQASRRVRRSARRPQSRRARPQSRRARPQPRSARGLAKPCARAGRAQPRARHHATYEAGAPQSANGKGPIVLS